MPPVSPTAGQIARARAATRAVWRADVAGRPAGDWADVGGLQLHTTGLPVVEWNGALLYDVAGLQYLDAAAGWFGERGMPWGLLVPAELDVAPPGFRHVGDQRVMIRDLEDLPALPDHPLRWDAPAEDVAVLQAGAFEMPMAEARAFVAPKLGNPMCDVVVVHDRDGQPVASATGVLGDGVIAVFGVGTLRRHRRQGLGSAVTLAVVHRARERGADLAYLNPSDLGYGAYRKLGFVDAPGWRIWSPLS